jgi:hypothetical protein
MCVNFLEISFIIIHKLFSSLQCKIWKRLEILQNKAIPVALNLLSYTFVEYIQKIGNIPKIKQYATTLLSLAITKVKSNNENKLENIS